MKIRILRSAQDDLGRGIDFYESQNAGLGDYFLESLLSDIDSLQLYGGVHRVEQGFHRFKSKRFPFWIFYTMEDQDILIRAVLDARQNPRSIKSRLNSEQ